MPAKWPARPVPRLGQWALGLAAELPGLWRAAVDYRLWVLRLGLTEDPARFATVIDWLSLAGHNAQWRRLR